MVSFSSLLITSNNEKDFNDHSFLVLLGCNFGNAAELSSKYDGAYTYTHFCKGEDSSKYDGSQFIINEGILSNDRSGAGRWIIKKKFLKLVVMES